MAFHTWCGEGGKRVSPDKLLVVAIAMLLGPFLWANGVGNTPAAFPSFYEKLFCSASAVEFAGRLPGVTTRVNNPLFPKGVTAVLTDCSGTADAVLSQSGVLNPGNALGASDGTFAQLYDVADEIVLDLTDIINEGGTIQVRWRKNPSTSGNPSCIIQSSEDGINYTDVSNSPFLLTSTSFFTQDVTLLGDARYIRFESANSFNMDLDAVSYTAQPCGGTILQGPGQASCLNGNEIGGIVFNDYDNDGAKDALEPYVNGVSVRIFDANGQIGSADETGDDGAFLFTGLTPDSTYRIEFEYPDWFFSGREGGDSKSNVRFATPGACNLNLGIYKPCKYCGVADPTIAITCFTEGAYNGANANEPALVGFPYSAEGHDFTGTTKTANYEGVMYATHSQIGATYGTAWQATKQRLYVGAFHKRYVGYGPEGPDAIYQFDENGMLLGSLSLDNLFGTADIAGADPHNFAGVEPMDIGTNNASFDGVGKRAFGDLEMSGDGNTLFVVNLFDRKIYAIDVSDGVAANATFLSRWTTPDPTGAGRHRPFGLAWHNDKLWLGTVDENADSAWVHSLDPAGAVFSLEFRMGLNFTRQSVLGNATSSGREADWRDWASNPGSTSYGASGPEIFHPQPMLSDIEFDGENMNLGFRDRFGDQTGMGKYFNAADSLVNKLTYGTVAGDIIRVCRVNGVFTLESGSAGSCAQINGLNNSGPNGYEYFFWDIYHTGSTWNTQANNGGFHWETAQGGLLQIAGEKSVMTTVMDPFNDFSGGVAKFENATGKRQGLGTSSTSAALVGGYTIFESGDYSGGYPPNNGFFAKANGLGDIEAFCTPPPLEVGNFVWNDLDSNGIQSPGEPGINGVVVKLFKNGSEIAATTTAAGGKYGFSSAASGSAAGYVYNVADLLPLMNYEIRIENTTSQDSLSGLVVTFTDYGGGDSNADLRDNDASPSGSNAVIAFATGNAGENNHNLDFGFKNASVCSLSLNLSITDATCHGLPDGSLNLTLSGGTAPFTYDWDNDGTGDNNDPQDLNNIPAGVYNVTVTDGAGCSQSFNTEVSEPTAIQLSASTQNVTLAGGSDGAINLTVSGGTMPYFFDWDADGTGDNDDPEDLSGLQSNSYNITVSDGNGCTETEGFFISEPPCNLIIDATTTDVSCQGATDGSIQITISGAALPITFDWSNDGTGDNDDGEDLTNVPAGVYDLVLTDHNGCFQNFNVEISEPAVLVVGGIGTNVTSSGGNDGAIDLTISGGTLPYTFDWDNDGTGDNDDPEDLTGLQSGSYNVTVTDGNGCTETAGFVINQPDCTLSLDAVSTDASCHGAADGSVNLTITGGQAPFHIDWDNDGTGDNDDPEDLAGLTAGTYAVTVLDDDGCMANFSLDIAEPTLLTVNGIGEDVTSPGGNDGAIDLTVSGGTLPYTFDWDNDGTGDNDDPEDLTGLQSGSYNVTATDGNGCTETAGFVINQPDCTLSLDAVSTDASCHGAADGSINLTITGGNAPFFIDWDNDGTGDNDDPEDLAGLTAGTYSVTVLDDDGCMADFSLDIAEPTLLTVNGIGANVTSPGGNDGAIDLTVSGGTLPYTFDWDNDGTGDNDDPEDLTGLQSGSYNVTATDGNGCTETAGFLIGQPGCDLTAQAVGFDETCAGSDGAATVTATGGLGDVSYLWSNGATAASISGLESAVYTVTVSDEANCTASASVHILEPQNGCTFDLALRKTLAAGQTDVVRLGDTVSFTITIFNQGEEPAHNVFVTEYLPFGYTYQESLNPGWDDFGASPFWFYSGPLAPGDSASIDIRLIVNEFAQPGLLNNYAEIQSADNDANFSNTPPQDDDSTPDAFFGNDPGGQPGTPSDDVISGNGNAPYGNNDAATDEDDHDGEGITLEVLSVGNTVFYDLENDGVFNNDDYGAVGVGVELYSVGPDSLKNTNDDVVMKSTYTNSFGEYGFFVLEEGLYYVKLSGDGIPAGYLSSTGDGHFDNDGSGPYEPYFDTNNNADGKDDGSQMGAMVMSDTIRLSFGDETADGDSDPNKNPSVDFGLYLPLEPASVGDFVWYDLDDDGVQGTNPAGAPGVIVWLYDLGDDGVKGNDDSLLLTTITNGDGFYLFDSLLPGFYYVVFDVNNLPGGYGVTFQDAGNDDAADSDANAMGMTEVFHLESGDHLDTLDLGLSQPDLVFDIDLEKILAPGQTTSIDLGDDVRYLIKVTNQGQLTASNLVVFDHLPIGTSLSPNDPNWTLISSDTATYTFPADLLPGESDSVEIILRVLYGASGRILVNVAEVLSVTDAVGNPIQDVDSEPNNGDLQEDDVDDASIELVPHDPTGWIYCDKTGKIITGGTISVTGPNGIPNDQVIIIADGSSGYYEFFTDGTPGIYTLTFNHPAGYPMSSTCLPLAGPFDPTGLPDPVVLGMDTVGMYISDTTCASNPYYLTFDLEPGDPFIERNNLPVSCVFIGSIVCDDSNHNDLADAGDMPIANTTVYLYDCTDLTNPIDSVVTNAQGEYNFEGLTPGDYTVGYDLPAYVRPVASTSIDAAGFSPCITLNWGECDTTTVICLYACPTINAGADVAICLGDTTQLAASMPYSNGSISWSPGGTLSNPAVLNPQAFPNATTSYIVSYNDGLGCVDADTVVVSVGSPNPFLTNMPFTNQTVECGSAIPFEAPTFGDNCDPNLDIQLDSVFTDLPCGYQIVRTWTATNNYGGSLDFVQTVTVDDNTPPSMSASHTFFGAILDGDTLYADCTQIPSLDSLAFASFDACGVPVVNFTENVTFGNCDVVGYVQSRFCGWTSTDSCGNTDSLFFTVIITDTTPPVLQPAPADATLSCNAIPAAANLIATDACDTSVTVVLVETPTTNADGCLTQIVRTWTAMDDCGNTDVETQTITVFDNGFPTLTGIPADTTVGCTAFVPGVPAVGASDNCDGSPDLAFNQTTIGDPAGCNYQIIRTWTATDACGNVTTDNQIIVVSDTEDPVIAGVPADVTVSCVSVPPVPGGITATDNCDTTPTLIFDQTPTADANGCVSQILRTWTATDDCGNSTVATQTLTLIDTLPPLMFANHAFFGNIQHGDTLYADCTQIPSLDSLGFAAFDECCPTITTNFTENVTRGVCDVDGFIQNRYCGWTATDCCGNTDSLYFWVIVRDLTPPVLSGVPANQTVSCEGVPAVATGITATDLCFGDVPVIFSQTTNGAGCNYQILRTWTATDSCGNVASQTQTITVQDLTPPTFNPACEDVLVFYTSAGAACPASATVSLAVGDVISHTDTWTAGGMTVPAFLGCVTDNCALPDDIIMRVASIEIENDNCGRTFTVRFAVEDDCGNVNPTEFVFVVAVVDDEAPVLNNIPPNTTVSCDAIPNPSAVTATDDCDTTPTIALSETRTAGCPYVITRTWTASDDCGNTTTASQTINVFDNTPPVLADPPANQAIMCEIPVPAPAALTASDNCDTSVGVSMNETYVGDPTSGCYLILRTWTATDDCGNTDTATQEIAVTDLTPPVLLNLPASGSLVDCDNLIAGVTATDNCDGNMQIVVDDTPVTSSSGCVTQMIRRWTVSDDCGNTTTAARTLSVTNTTPPVITIINPMMAGVMDGDVLYLECQEVMGLTAADVSVTDDCCGAATVTFEEYIAAGTCAANGYLQRMTCGWIAEDCCGNRDSLFFTVFVVDNSAPLLYNVPADLMLVCGQSVPPLATVVAVDNCDNQVPVTFSTTTTTVAGVTRITRTWTATDDCGHMATDSQIITLPSADATPPDIVNAPASVVLNYPGPVPPVPGNVSATDNCDASPSLTFNESRSGNSCCYVITRTWTATDDSGNTATATQTITVNDNVLPVLANVPADLTITCNASIPPSTVTASDNCVANPLIFIDLDTTVLACGLRIRRTWTAIDVCNNLATATQIITVNDAAPPVLTGVPASLNLACGASLPSPATVTATDACDSNVPVAYSQTQSGSGCAYTVTRTWTATDDCGNTVSQSQVITTGDDNTPPVLVGVPANATVNCSSTLTLPTVTATDNCDASPTISFNQTQTTGCPYTITRTWTATDDCGNNVSASQVLTVNDPLPPVLGNLPTPVVVTYCGEPLPPVAAVTATDACSGTLPVSYNEMQIGSGCHYVIARTWIATDGCGNNAAFVQSINVYDTLAPTMGNLPPPVQVVNCQNIPPPAAVTATDNCDATPTLNMSSVATMGCPYTITRTYMATDDCGNTSSFVQTITVFDDTAPTLQLTHPMLDQLADGDTLIMECDETEVFDANDAVATDDCNMTTVTLSESVVHGDCPNDGFITILRCTWTATDACGNAGSITIYMRIEDNDPPVLSALPAPVTVACGDPIPACVTPTATDDCGIPALTFDRDSIPTANGYDLVCNWTATDNCGNTASASQTIHVIDDGSPIFTGIPGDTTVYEILGGTVPPIPAVIATDGCTGIELPVSFDAVKTPQNGGCDTLVTYIWSADDGMGNVSVDSQTILLVGGLIVNVNTTPDTCNLNVGRATLTPGIYAYNWSDGGSGAVRTNMPDGTYVVSATDGVCTTLVNVQIGLVNPPLSVSVATTPDTCQTGVGKATLLPASYAYNWSDGGSGNARTNLLAGAYTVTATRGTCSTTLNVNVLDVQTMFSVSPVTAPDTCGTGVGYAALTPSNLVYTWSDGGLGAVRNDLIAGSYTVTVTKGICQITQAVNIGSYCDCTDPVLEEILVEDASCGAADGSASVLLDGNEADFDYLWLPATGTPNADGNARTGLTAGHYVIFAWPDGKEYCAEKYEVDVFDNCPRCSPVFEVDSAQYTTLNPTDYICLPVPHSVSLAYDVFVDGFAYAGAKKACGNQTSLMYDYSSLTASGLNGLFYVTWIHNGLTFNTLVSDMEELVSAMNGVDGSGGWYNNITMKAFVSRNHPGNYGALTIEHVDTQQSFVLTTSSQSIAMGTAIKVKSGQHEIVYVAPGGDCPDTLQVTVTVLPKPAPLPYEDSFGSPLEDRSDEAANAESDLTVFTGFSPNGDGRNDFFRIDGLEGYPDHELSIYNAYGHLVFKTRRYRNDWGGAWGSNYLPDGTYFYLLDDGKGKRHTGYVQVRR
jgi:gliding motility-associated-like protein/uncharacterized repeat protein (TIGR01451 family)